jgi:hypothetical protein
MRWSDERWVKVYTRDTPEWAAVSLGARGLFYELTRKVDAAGVLNLGRKGVAALAAVVRATPKQVAPLLAELLEDGCVVQKGELLVIPNFVEAQGAVASDAERKRRERERDRDLALHAEAEVTPSHAVSRDVTPSHHPEERRGEETIPPIVPPAADAARGTRRPPRPGSRRRRDVQNQALAAEAERQSELAGVAAEQPDVAKLLTAARDRTTTALWDRWLRPLRGARDGAVLRLRAPDPFHASFVQENHGEWLRGFAHELLGVESVEIVAAEGPRREATG